MQAAALLLIAMFFIAAFLAVKTGRIAIAAPINGIMLGFQVWMYDRQIELRRLLRSIQR